MATIEEMYSALEAADQAGDVAAATEIAQMIQQASAAGEQPATPTIPGGIPERVSFEGTSETDPFAAMSRTPEMRRQLIAEQAGIEEGQANRVASLFGRGMAVEGPQRAWAGLKQVGALAMDFLRPRKEGQDTRMDSVTAQEMLRQAVATEQALERGDDMLHREAGAMVGEVLPSILIPQVATSRWVPQTILKGLGKDVTLGGMGGLLMYNAEKENLKTAVIDGGLSALLGGTVGLYDKFSAVARNQVGKFLLDAEKTGSTKKAYDQMREVLPNVDASLGQITGIPELITLERRAYNSDQVNFFRDQTNQFIQDFHTAMSRPVYGGVGAPEQVTPQRLAEARDAFDARLKAARMRSSSAYERNMNQARTLPGAKDPVRTPEFLDTLDLIEGQNADALRGNPVMSGFLSDIRKATQIKPADAPRIILPGQASMSPVGQAPVHKDLTADQIASLLRGVNQHADSTDPVEKAVALKLKDSLMRDLDQIDPTSLDSLALRQILETNQEYAVARSAIQTAADSAAYKLLNLSDADVGADTIVRRFNELSPSQRRTTREYMEQNSPELLEQLRQQYVNDAVRLSRANTPAMDAPADLAQLDSFLFDSSRGFDLRSSGLWGAEDVKKLEGVREGLRVIYNTRPQASKGAGTPILPEDLAINAVSMSSEFLTRQMTRILMSTKASSFFTDPNVYKALTTINHSTSGSAANNAARASLLALTRYMIETPDDEESLANAAQVLERQQQQQGGR